MRKILIDCDTGIDDSIALLYALLRKDVQVVGIVSGCGNTNAAQAAENSLRLLRLARVPYEVPVVVGANQPLVGEWEGPVPHIHGENGIGDVTLPETEQRPLSENAADFIIRMAHTYPHELTLVTLGRLTNIAHALQKDPELPKLFHDLVLMGGCYHVPGNVSPVAEANIAGDPEAADMVFRAGFDLTQVGLDVTTKVHLTKAHLELLAKHCQPENQPIAGYICAAMELYFRFNRESGKCMDYCPVHDPLAMVVALNPSVVSVKKMPMRVECSGELCRGMLVGDLRARPMDAPFAGVCVDVDTDRAINDLLSVLLGNG